MRRDLSDHVAGANGVSNGVDRSLPALKHERASRLSPSLPRANAYSNNEPSIIVGIIIIAESAVLVLLLPFGQLPVFRLYSVRDGSIYEDLMRAQASNLKALRRIAEQFRAFSEMYLPVF
ncbi:hypothetical protein P5V15_003551 [Pogonomyrmex californicus]